jgi:seryl-tRNA synthetase
MGNNLENNSPDYNIFNKKSVKYQELNEKFEISDLKRGQKVSGHRGYFLKNNGLKISFALTQYGIEFLEN